MNSIFSMLLTSPKQRDLSHKEIQKYFGVSLGMIRNVMLNQFHPGLTYRNIFTYLRLRNYTGPEFKDFLHDGQLKDPQTKKHYSIIYQDCAPYTVKRAHQVMCSYREAPDCLNLEPIVIVRIAKENVL